MPRMPWSSRIVGRRALVDERGPFDPLLALVVRDVLPLLLADRAGSRRFIGRAGTACRTPCKGQTGQPSRAAPRTRRAACAGTCRRAVRAHEPVAVVVAEALQVAGERGRVARDVDDARRPDLAEPPQRLAGKPGARRVDDDDVGLAGALAEIAEHLADVAGEERGVADRVQLLVLDRARDGLLGDLDAPDRQRISAPARARSSRSRSRGRRRSRRR